jgi:hypothetical protein
MIGREDRLEALRTRGSRQDHVSGQRTEAARIMPTATDEKLAENLTELRVEVAERFGSIEKAPTGVERELRLIWWIGGFVAGLVVILAGASITIAWYASGVVSDVRYRGQRLEAFKGRLEAIGSNVKDQARRLDRIDGRLDTMGKQLDVLISRTAPKPGS